MERCATDLVTCIFKPINLIKKKIDLEIVLLFNADE